MIIQEADHPLIVLRELEVSLPEAIAVLTLESTLTPNLSGRRDWIVQSSLDEDPMDGSVADGRGSLNHVISQVPFDLVRSPMFTPPQFQDEVHRWLRGLVVAVGSSGFDD